LHWAIDYHRFAAYWRIFLPIGDLAKACGACRPLAVERAALLSMCGQYAARKGIYDRFDSIRMTLVGERGGVPIGLPICVLVMSDAGDE